MPREKTLPVIAKIVHSPLKELCLEGSALQNDAASMNHLLESSCLQGKMPLEEGQLSICTSLYTGLKAC